MAWNPEIEKALAELLSTKADDKTAVFDVDGTLWYDDVGEAFFHYQVTNGLVASLQSVRDPWQKYKKMEVENRANAYGWLAEINAGISEQQLRNQIREFYRQHFKGVVRPEMKKLVEDLLTHGFDVWLCSGSIRWALEPVATELGINLSHLIGAEVEVDAQGKLTNNVTLPIPYTRGKKYWVEEKLKTQPLLVAGNSMGDLEMLELAKLQLVINMYPHLLAVEQSEKELLIEAKNRNWLIQVFQQ